MKKGVKNLSNKLTLQESADIIYDEITQNLCLAKLILSMTEPNEIHELQENIKKSKDLVSKSILHLRALGESITGIKNSMESE